MRSRLAAIALAVTAATLLSSAASAGGGSLKAPSGLKPFLLRASEPAAHEFPRTPSFSWLPVRGAESYQFQLAKSPSFGEGSVFWSRNGVKSPAVAVPVALPWMTGSPYAAYARVPSDKAVTEVGVPETVISFSFSGSTWGTEPRSIPLVLIPLTVFSPVLLT